MKEENMEEWFAAQREGCWDLAEPKNGHKERFLAKMGQKTAEKKVINLNFWWKPLAVAASLLFIIMLSLSRNTDAGKELAAVSPKMEETQDFFREAIANELFEIKERRTPENNKLIDDALDQLQILETDYTKLKKDLTKSGEDKRVIYAMITNFQTRIELLQQVMKQLDNTEQLNAQHHEKRLF